MEAGWFQIVMVASYYVTDKDHDQLFFHSLCIDHAVNLLWAECDEQAEVACTSEHVNIKSISITIKLTSEVIDRDTLSLAFVPLHATAYSFYQHTILATAWCLCIPYAEPQRGNQAETLPLSIRRVEATDQEHSSHCAPNAMELPCYHHAGQQLVQQLGQGGREG